MRRRTYTLTNLDNTVATNFDRKAYVISSIDLGNIDANLSSFVGAGQNGQTITSRSYGTRDISIQGFIMAEDFETMKSRKMLLQKIIVPTSDFWLVIDNKYKIRMTAESTLVYSKEWYKNNEWLTAFSIEGVCSNPFFQTLEPRKANITGWVKDFHFPYCNPVGSKFTFGHQLENKIVDVVNESEVPTGMIISMKAIGGEVISPYLMDVSNNKKFQLNTVIPAGEEVIINTNFGEKSIRNVSTGENWLQYMDLNSNWLQMPTGLSSFKFGDSEGSTGTLECNVAYIPQLIEV